jgi:hypothetical protein
MQASVIKGVESVEKAFFRLLLSMYFLQSDDTKIVMP